MVRLQSEYLAKRIVQHYVNISNRQKEIAVNHFVPGRIPRRRTYDTIKKFEEFGVVGDRVGTGRRRSYQSNI